MLPLAAALLHEIRFRSASGRPARCRDHSCGIADHRGAVGHIVDHHGAGADQRAFADGDPGENRGVAADGGARLELAS